MRCPECGRKNCCGADMAPRIEKLETAIKIAIDEFDYIAWGYDGNCGMDAVMAKLGDAIEGAKR